MSFQSDAAKTWIELLLKKEYGEIRTHSPQSIPRESLDQFIAGSDELYAEKIDAKAGAFREYLFAYPERRWRFDWAIPMLKVAIELDGATWVQGRHNTGAGTQGDREKNNAAMSAGWRVWHYAPNEVIKAGRKTMEDEPILKKLPWKV